MFGLRQTMAHADGLKSLVQKTLSDVGQLITAIESELQKLVAEPKSQASTSCIRSTP